MAHVLSQATLVDDVEFRGWSATRRQGDDAQDYPSDGHHTTGWNIDRGGLSPSTLSARASIVVAGADLSDPSAR
jgi:hypothetical protein